MIKPNEWHEAKYWGKFHINKVAELPQPIIFETPRWGRTSFRPTIAEIQWEDGHKELWFPYYIGPAGKERFGQYAPMMAESELLVLLREAIKQNFFSREFLSLLAEAITEARQ